MAYYLFHTYDPRGENVVLWDDRYYSHICKHMVPVAAIQTTVEKPDIITRDVTYSLRDNYYAQGVDARFPNAWIKVCVEFGSDMGKVITAFVVDRPKPEEEILWRK